MRQPPLAQSADKSALFTRLGLSDHIHRIMLQEAASGRDRLSAEPANLTPQSQSDPSVRQPYKWDELSETAKHREILRIAEWASANTRPYYERGRYSTSVGEENWVVRWYLWHSFRYRDNRGRDTGGSDPTDPENPDAPGYWDPVRHD